MCWPCIAKAMAVTLTRDEKERMTWVNGKSKGIPDGGAWLYSDVRCLKKNSKATYDQVADVRNVLPQHLPRQQQRP